MKPLSKIEFAAALYSPLAAGPGMFLSMLVNDPKTLNNQDWWVTILQPFYFVLLALPISGLGMAIIGIPVYLFLKISKINHPWLVAVLGAPVGYCVFLVLGGGENLWARTFVIAGLAVSTCAAAIIHRGKKCNSFGRGAGAHAP